MEDQPREKFHWTYKHHIQPYIIGQCISMCTFYSHMHVTEITLIMHYSVCNILNIYIITSPLFMLMLPLCMSTACNRSCIEISTYTCTWRVYVFFGSCSILSDMADFLQMVLMIYDAHIILFIWILSFLVVVLYSVILQIL